MDEDLQSRIEQDIAHFIIQQRKARKITADALGATVYPGCANARMKVQTLTQKQGNGKPRGLRLGEFVALAIALNIDPVKLLADVLAFHHIDYKARDLFE